ncbi:MAG: glycosyltransferase family 1 protein, partial [Akkermansiaceae bacterium]
MRILQIFNQYRFRGGEEMWVDAIPQLLAGMAEVDELRFHSNDWIGADAPSPLKQICLMGDNPSLRAALRERVASFKPDVLLFHNVI